jgi:hypothetical protein
MRWIPQGKDHGWQKQTAGDYISKEDKSLPTIATEAILLFCVINAEEKRDVAIISIPNAFIQTWVEDDEDMAASHQDLWSPHGYPHTDCSQHLQILCHD